jgi:alpha-1,6-mannosyltransferase
MTIATLDAALAPNTDLRLALTGAAIVTLTIAGPLLHRAFGATALIAVTIVCGVGAALALHLSSAVNERRGLWIVLLAAGAMRLALLFGDNYFSSDLFRYIWDGRVQAAGVNPYRYVPAAPELAFLRDANIFPNINRPDFAVTIYPPAAQMIFYLVTRLGDSVLVMKAAMLAFDAVTIATLIAILRLLGKTPVAVAAYAWHPLPVWELALNGHVDAAMMALVVLALWLTLRGRGLLGGLLATVGALVKPTALLALPVFWRPWDWRLPLAAAATVVLFYLPYLSVGWGVLGYLPDYAREEGVTTGSGFWLLTAVQGLTGPLVYGKWLYLPSAAAVLGLMALRAAFCADRTPKATISALAWLLFTFLFLLSPDYPWYFVVLVPFLALTPFLAAWILTVGAFVLHDVINNDIVPNLPTREALLYGGTLAGLALDLWLKCREPRQARSTEATP